MKAVGSVLAATMMIVFGNPVDATPSCVPVDGTSRSQVQSSLSRRAVKALELVLRNDWATNKELRRIVSNSVSVRGGVGDVGLPLPSGLASLHHFSRRIEATSYRYSEWQYLDGPWDGCAKQEISVEFLDEKSGRSWPVTLEFEDGRLQSFQTWQRRMVSGPLSFTTPTKSENR